MYVIFFNKSGLEIVAYSSTLVWLKGHPNWKICEYNSTNNYSSSCSAYLLGNFPSKNRLILWSIWWCWAYSWKAYSIFNITGLQNQKKGKNELFRGVGSYSCSASESHVERPALHPGAGWSGQEPQDRAPEFRLTTSRWNKDAWGRG